MNRYAKPNVSIDELKKVVEDYGYPYKLVCENDVVSKDLTSMVNVDFENTEYVGEYDMPGTEDMEHFEMLGGIPVCWCVCGGDWENPIVFCLYIDDHNNLRGYIPSEGNAYNHDEKCAYGSDSDEARENFDKERDYVFDANKMRQDVENNLIVVLP